MSEQKLSDRLVQLIRDLTLDCTREELVQVEREVRSKTQAAIFIILPDGKT